MEPRLNGPQIAVFIDFENVATSAEANLGDFNVTAVMDVLRTRGRLLIKRAYGDWGRFHRYRRAMLENGLDLFQLYSVGMQQKNRADVRLAIDAVETVFTRPNIDLYAIISGDSDFTELVHKLRDHGKYTIGIGLRAATSDLLRRACDEFIFYETLVREELADVSDELQLPDPRELLRRALVAAEQKGETPIFAGRLKQIILALDSSFSEANYGFAQFRAFLEAHADLVSIEEQGLQLYVSLEKTALSPAAPAQTPPPAKPVADLTQRYRSFLREANLRVVDPTTRAQVLADFLRIMHEHHQENLSLNRLADMLKDRYDAENALTQKIAVTDMLRLLIMGSALRFLGGQASCDAPLEYAHELDLGYLTTACEKVYIWRLVEGGVPVRPEQLAPVLYAGEDAQPRVELLCQELVHERLIVPAGDSFAVAPEVIDRLLARPTLESAVAAMLKASLPPGEPISSATAEELFREGSDLRQKDFAGSSRRYLQAGRVQLETLRSAPGRAGFDDLKWYLASYCSVKAGHAFVTGSYVEAVPHYLAFFDLAQESDSVWPKIQRLVSPMTSYYFALAGKQFDESVPPNLGRSPACQVAFRIHNHPNAEVGRAWEELATKLASTNLGMIRQSYRDLASSIASVAASASDVLQRMERTQAFLAALIAEREGAVSD